MGTGGGGEGDYNMVGAQEGGSPNHGEPHNHLHLQI